MTDPVPLSKHDDAPRWLLLLIVLVLLLLVGAGFLWIDSRADMDHLVGRPAALGHQGPVTDIGQILNEGVPANLIGREVALDVRVHEVIGGYTFWVGSPAAGRVPVVLFGELTERQPPSEADLMKGQPVRLFGIIRRMRQFTAFGIDPMITEKQLREVRRRPVFISAWRVMVVPE